MDASWKPLVARHTRWILVAACFLVGSGAILAQAPASRSANEMLAERDAGARAFGLQCAQCHGTSAEGAIGPALNSSLRKASDEATLTQIIRNGIPGTGMPASATSDGQARQIAAYVWSLGHSNHSTSNGDVRRGQEIFDGKGHCTQCHTLAGRGGAIGPELGDIGVRRDAAELRASLVDPDAAVSDAFVKRASPQSTERSSLV